MLFLITPNENAYSSLQPQPYKVQQIVSIWEIKCSNTRTKNNEDNQSNFYCFKPFHILAVSEIGIPNFQYFDS